MGESVSAERVGSNAQSTSKAMQMFELRAKILRDQLPVDEFGLEWTEKPQINVFERVFPLLKMEAAIDLTASVYGIREDMLDPERIKLQQDAMLGAGGAVGSATSATTAPTNAPEMLKTPSRRHKSEIQKEISELNRGLSI